jgi:hypothetical protein
MQRTALKSTGKTVVAAALATQALLPGKEVETEARAVSRDGLLPGEIKEEKLQDEWQVVSAGRPVTIEFLTREETDEAAETAVQLMLGVKNGDEIEVYTDNNSISNIDSDVGNNMEKAELEMVLGGGGSHNELVPQDYDAFKAMTREVASDPNVQAAVWSNPAFKSLFGDRETDEERRTARLQRLGTPLHPNLLSPPSHSQSNDSNSDHDDDDGIGNEINLKALLRDMEKAFAKTSEVLASLSHHLGHACKDFFASLFGGEEAKEEGGAAMGREKAKDEATSSQGGRTDSIDMRDILTPVIGVVSAVMAIALLRRSGIFLRLRGRTTGGPVPSLF